MPTGRAAKTISLLNDCIRILREIQPCSTRAVCYQLFIRDLLSDMSKRSTNRIGHHLTRAREDGLIPWRWIVDEHRHVEGVASWNDPDEYIEDVLCGYRRNNWQDQPFHVELWSEKGTVRGTIKPVLDTYGVDLRVMHGYGSATVMNAVAELSQRIDKPLVVLYIGDYDPSGLHMSEVDIPGRIKRYGGRLSLIRIALTDADVTTGRLPSRPVSEKQRDPRYQWYRDHYGADFWELDALNPNVLRDRVGQSVHRLIDHERWEQATDTEEVQRRSMHDVIDYWRRDGSHYRAGSKIDGEVRP